MDPQVTGEAVELGRVGKRPVGQTQQQLRINIDYRLPFWDALSLDAGIVHTGPIAASVRPDPATGKQMNVATRTEIGLGLRYRFRIADNPAVLRLQVQNLTDARGWDPTSSGGFRVQNPRRFQAQLSADF
jgi:iron complex outermembrane receptor protein